MTTDFGYTTWILIIPFVTFLILSFFGMRLKGLPAGITGTVSLGVVTFLSWFTAIAYFTGGGIADGAYQKIVAANAVWLNLSDHLHIDMGVLLDPISVMMLVVISTVSFMVHIYSLGYMKGEKGFERYYAFLSLFTFSMMGLVVATNIFQMYIFWELVGVSSYLLIGFYYDRPSAVAASKKAFIVTRFADMGFLVGILILSYVTKTFDFVTLTDINGPAIASKGGAVFMGMSLMTWSMIFIFMGGAGKSAMFPLHIWLPDAMEGPTPVSALIHAATMVVAGVYLVARMFPVYYFTAPEALHIIAWVGAISSLFAAIIALTQTDIKRVLAYSTISQIGYMIFSLGVSGYGGHEGLGFMASGWHLFNHAMFKALLFLGAGSVIHAVHSNDMKDMGGLRRYMPVTNITFLIACLTIAGVPPLSGFFSKDEILTAALHHNKLLFAIEYIVAGLTAFYMFRLYFSVFHGRDIHYHHTPHESPATMTVPLIILAIGSVFAGFLPFSRMVTSDGVPFESHIEWSVAIPSVAIGLLGIGLAWIMYRKETTIPDRMASFFSHGYRWAYNKFYIDEIYIFVTKKVIFKHISHPVAWFDRHIVDGTMNGIAWVTQSVSSMIKGFQSGQLQKYGYVFITGVIALAIAFIYLVK